MYVIRGWGIVLQKGLFLRGLGLGNCTAWLRLSVLNSARRDLRCLSQFLITGYTVCSLIFFRCNIQLFRAFAGVARAVVPNKSVPEVAHVP